MLCNQKNAQNKTHNKALWMKKKGLNGFTTSFVPRNTIVLFWYTRFLEHIRSVSEPLYLAPGAAKCTINAETNSRKLLQRMLQSPKENLAISS